MTVMKRTRVTQKCFFLGILTVPLIWIAYCLHYGEDKSFSTRIKLMLNLNNVSKNPRTLTTELLGSTVPVMTFPPMPVLRNTSQMKICRPPAAYMYNFTKDVTAEDVLNKTAIKEVQPGGSFEPRDCRPRDEVAIIVPYRNRSTHLETLINHLHNFLQQQMITYGIFVVEPVSQIRAVTRDFQQCGILTSADSDEPGQPPIHGLQSLPPSPKRAERKGRRRPFREAGSGHKQWNTVLPLTFNKGILNNVGFKEAMTRHNYSCIIINDVDSLPLNSKNSYTCGVDAVHMATEQSKKKYKIPYHAYIGGVLSLTRDFYRKVNGFSNLFFGWGGEDDDMEMRIKSENKKPRVARPEKGIGRYLSLPHGRDNLNPENLLKGKLFKSTRLRYKHEGLTTLRFKVVARELRPLYTYIKVSYNETDIMKEFYDKWNKDKTIGKKSPGLNKTQLKTT